MNRPEDSGAEWRASLEEMRDERVSATAKRELARNWMGALMDGPDAYREIGALGQNDGGTDALTCGWGLMGGIKVYGIAEARDPSGAPRTLTGIAKAARVQQLAADRGVPLVEVVSRQRRNEEEFVGAELGIWGYGVDFHGLTRLREAAPRAVVIDGPVTAQSFLDSMLSDYVALGSQGAAGLSQAARPKGDQCGAWGFDLVAESREEAVEAVRKFVDLVARRVGDERPPKPDGTSCGELCDAGSVLPLKPVVDSPVELALGRVRGVTACIAVISDGAWDVSSGRRMFNLLRLTQRRRIPLVWLVNGAPQAEDAAIREMAAVARAAAGQPACRVVHSSLTSAWADSFTGGCEVLLDIDAEQPAERIRALLAHFTLGVHQAGQSTEVMA